ncbi:transketolase [bacterium]|nr:MAG: transketolase [bacterium]
MPNTPADDLNINAIRFLSVDAIEKAKSGHPGLPLGAAAMAYALWTRHLKHSPSNPHWFNRDRFVLSAGHGSMLLYALLYLTGYGLELDDLRAFRQLGSRTPGHPERDLAPGVEVTTGPLGQGFANGVGMAIAEANLAARFNRPGHTIIDHFTYAIVSDGDLMEGVTQEAASVAGHLGLGKLIYLYDDNHVSLANATDVTYTEGIEPKYEALGWHVQFVGHNEAYDVGAVARAIEAAQRVDDRPSLIIVRTTIGYGSPVADSYKSHGEALGKENTEKTKEALGWPLYPPFYVPEESLAFFRGAVERGRVAENAWETRFEHYAAAFPAEAAELRRMIAGELPEGLAKAIPTFSPEDGEIATRDAGGKVMNAVAALLPELIGGSADLDPSTKTYLKGLGDFQRQTRQGRNIHWGIREHAMGAGSNGLAAHGGLLPYTATFLTFSDYMKPAIRLAALSKLHVVCVFTHDSILLGEDGPTHQPIEHLAALRAVPGLTVLRPADANETAAAWLHALHDRGRPTVLVLTRQKLPVLAGTAGAPIERGAYVLAEAGGALDLILIATGSEVSLCLQARALLEQRGIGTRVVSMPSWELFEDQEQAYRDEVLPPAVGARLSVEAAATLGWSRWVGDHGACVGMHTFGESAPIAAVAEHFGFTPVHVAERGAALAVGVAKR